MKRSRLYKPERSNGRFNRRFPGVIHDQAPISIPDATPKEIASSIYCICAAGGITAARGGTYDSLRDEYTIVGKDQNGKATDFSIEGPAVAALIVFRRTLDEFDRLGLPIPTR